MPGTAILIASHGDGSTIPASLCGSCGGEAISACGLYRSIADAKVADSRARHGSPSAPYDAFVMPTTAIYATAHRRSRRTDQGVYESEPVVAAQLHRLINMIDGCAISLPCHREGRCAGRVDARRISGGSDSPDFSELAAAMEDAIPCLI